MLSRKERIIYVTTALTGLLVWIGVSMLSGRPEAWDSELYYSIGMGVMILAAASAGYVEPTDPWRWGISVVILQPLALVLMKTPGALMIVGLLIFAVLMFICTGASALGAVLRRYRHRRLFQQDGDPPLFR